VHQAEQQRAEPAGPALARLVEAEVLGLAPARHQVAVQRPRQRLAAPQHDPDQHRQTQPEPEAASGQEEPDRHDQGPQQQAPEHDVARPVATGQPTEGQGAAERDDLHQQDRHDQLAGAETELLRAVDAGHPDDRLDAVVEEQVGQQEHHRVAVAAQVAERAGQLAEGLAHQRSADGGEVDGRSVAQPQVGHQGEPRPPQSRAEQAEPHGLTLGQTQRVVPGDQPEVQREQDEAAEVAQRPPATGHPVALVRPGDLAQDRVVDHERAGQAQVGEHQQCHAQLPVGAPHEPQAARGQRAQPGQCGQDPSLVRRSVCDGADQGQQQRRHDRRERRGVEHQRAGAHRQPQHRQVGAAGGAVRQARARGLGRHGREVGREQHGRDRRDVRRVGPVVEVPRALLASAGRGRRLGGGAHAPIMPCRAGLRG